MEEKIILLVVLCAFGICTSYVLKGSKYPYVVIDNHTNCEERWYSAMTWVSIDNPTKNDGHILGAYLRGFNSEFKPVLINLKARVSGEVQDNGNWTLQKIAFNIRKTDPPVVPKAYSKRIQILKEPPTIYCAQVPTEEEGILYFKDITVTTANDANNSVEESNTLYIIMDEPLQYLIKLKETSKIESIYKTMRKRSIKLSGDISPEFLNF